MNKSKTLIWKNICIQYNTSNLLLHHRFALYHEYQHIHCVLYPVHPYDHAKSLLEKILVKKVNLLQDMLINKNLLNDK